MKTTSELTASFGSSGLVAVLDHEVTYLSSFDMIAYFAKDEKIVDLECVVDIPWTAQCIIESTEKVFHAYIGTGMPGRLYDLCEEQYRKELRYLSKTLKQKGKLLFLFTDNAKYCKEKDFLTEVSDMVIHLSDDIESGHPTELKAFVSKARGDCPCYHGMLVYPSKPSSYGQRVLSVMLCRDADWFISRGLTSLGYALHGMHAYSEQWLCKREARSILDQIGNVPPAQRKKRVYNALSLIAEHGIVEINYADVALKPDIPSKVLKDVGVERRRQIALGYTPEHDDKDLPGEHALAAVAYAINAAYQRAGKPIPDTALDIYPWDQCSFSPDDDPRDNLITAAALLVAEAERIDRENEPSWPKP